MVSSTPESSGFPAIRLARRIDVRVRRACARNPEVADVGPPPVLECCEEPRFFYDDSPRRAAHEPIPSR